MPLTFSSKTSDQNAFRPEAGLLKQVGGCKADRIQDIQDIRLNEWRPPCLLV